MYVKVEAFWVIGLIILWLVLLNRQRFYCGWCESRGRNRVLLLQSRENIIYLRRDWKEDV